MALEHSELSPRELGQFYYNYRQSGLQNTQYYDLIGRTSSIKINIAGSAQDNAFGFAYTPASQIKSRTTSNDLYANTAHYDVTRDYAVNGLNQYTTAGPSAFTYDANGNLTSDGSVNFTYDVENRLIAASGAKTANLIYDPLGRLYEVNQGGVLKTRFIYDGDALVLEYDQFGSIKHRYVHGNGVDQPYVWYTGSAVNAATRRHMFANWQGSISAITDASGNAIQVNAYDAYGIPNATNIGRFQYTGQILIPEIGIYHYKARAYSPYLGRFLQTDPIGYEDQYNLYAYVGNDPVSYQDPDGKMRCKSLSCQRELVSEHSNSDTVEIYDEAVAEHSTNALFGLSGLSGLARTFGIKFFGKRALPRFKFSFKRGGILDGTLPSTKDLARSYDVRHAIKVFKRSIRKRIKERERARKRGEDDAGHDKRIEIEQRKVDNLEEFLRKKRESQRQ
ncbi:MAG: hypothetical protein COA41_06815 [Sphingopyxis sp.]|nr:MAG: hypothetical protein COA41_06815 [Sphingopyxis sp.]